MDVFQTRVNKLFLARHAPSLPHRHLKIKSGETAVKYLTMTCKKKTTKLLYPKYKYIVDPNAAMIFFTITLLVPRTKVLLFYNL